MPTLVTSGTTIDILNLTLSSTDDVQVGFSTDVNTIIIKARTGVDIQVRASRGAPNYFTIPSGQSLTLALTAQIINNVAQPDNVWLRSTSATPVAEVIGIYGG